MFIINIKSYSTKNGSHNFKEACQQVKDSRNYQIDLNSPNYKENQEV